jgi:hypothetical protein
MLKNVQIVEEYVDIGMRRSLYRHSWRGWRKRDLARVPGVIFVLGILLTTIVALPNPVRGSGETGYTSGSATPCLSSNSVQTGYIYTSEGSAYYNKTWAIVVTFGINAPSDNSQGVRFYFNLIDNNLGKGVAQYGTSENDWNDHNTYSRSTLVAHVGTDFKLYWDVENVDSASQCFTLNAYPAYFS